MGDGMKSQKIKLPCGIWAFPAVMRDGRYGVMCGQGGKTTGFIPEHLLTPEYMAKLRQSNTGVDLVIEAMRHLPELKAMNDYHD
jgi:hypothetical protein